MQSQSPPTPRGILPLLIGLLSFELIGWGALYWELDRPLGFGIRFWGVVVLALAACLVVWFSVRALIVRRGWFTLKEFLAFVLLVGAALGWAGHVHQQKREQRAIAKFLAERGSSVHWGVDDKPGVSHLIPAEYRHDIRAAYADLTQLSAEEFALFARLPELESLQVFSFRDTARQDGKRLTEDHLRHVRSVRSLKSLTLSETELAARAMAALRGHPSLRSLTIYGPRIPNEALAHLPGLPNLRYLSLQSPRLDDDCLVHVGNCHQLEDLYLYGTRINDAGLAHLAALSRLRSLTLYGVPITDAGMVHLTTIPSLSSLDLSATKVTDAGMQHLRRLKQLRTLVLQETTVTPQQVAQLENELPHLHVSR
jgi:hypothetical protein